MRIKTLIHAAIVAACPAAGFAMTLEFPVNSVRVLDETEALGSYQLPLGGWEDDKIDALTAEGEVIRQVWRIPSTNLTTLQILGPLREQLVDDGYEVVFECKDWDCGGFDFRYGIDVAPEPQMHVDLGNYRFLSARMEGDDKDEVLSLLVSRRSDTAFVQVTIVGPSGAPRPNLTPSTKTQPTISTAGLSFDPTGNGLGVMLESEGYAVLDDLTFAIGSSTLSDGTYPSLAALADYLKTNPNRNVTLVGHTDAEGSLPGNVALSKRRATSVMDRLVDTYGISRSQVSAEGMGYLSPRASNLTDNGRNQNRRVEVILTPAE